MSITAFQTTYSKLLIHWNKIWTHNHLVGTQTLNYLVKLASLDKWLSVRLQTKWLWVQIPLQSLNKLHVSHLFQARGSLAFRLLWIVDPLCMWHDNNIQYWLTICSTGSQFILLNFNSLLWSLSLNQRQIYLLFMFYYFFDTF